MKRNIILLSFIFFFSFSFAQINPIDFEAGGNGAAWTWTVFENGPDPQPAIEIIPNPVSGVGNTTTTVAKFTAVDAGMDWAGCETTDNGEFTFDANNCTVKLWVYKSVSSQVMVKFEGAGAPVQVENIVNTTTNAWEELTFDFSAHIGSTFTKLVFFPDFAARDQDNIIYFDEITFSAQIVPTEPTVAAPAPTQDQADVISMFSDTYADVAVDTWLTVWSAGTLEDVLIDGNPTKKYSNLNFAGIETTGANLIDASGMTHFSIDMWTPDNNEFKVKLVDFGADGAWGGGDDTEHEVIYLAPNTGSWIEYDIPLTDFVNLTSSEHIAQLIISKPNLGTIFVDNIYFYNEVLPPTEPTVAAPDPTQDQADVISMFSDVYADVAVDTWLTGWSAGTLENVMIDGNPTKKYSNLNFAGIETTGANLIDASGMTHFSIDMWTPDDNEFKIKLVDFGADAAWGGGDDTEHEIIYLAPNTGTWIEYDIPLSDFTNLANTDHIAQLIISKPNLGTVFIDNIYFWKDPLAAGADATLSDLLVDGNTISGFSPNTITYDVELPLGTTVVPTVTATTTNLNATHVVNATAALPGTTTVVVTSEDGTTEKTYSINFTLVRENIALNKPGFASTEMQPAANAFDGIMSTRWESTFEDPQWIYVDLAGVYEVDGVNLHWEGAFATEYLIEVSSDAISWTQVYAEAAGDGGLDEISFAPANARYVRMYGTARGTIYGYSLYEFEVFGIFDTTSDATLSDLQVDGTTVDGFSPSTLLYNVEIPYGSIIVPTVAATTTSQTANYIINNAPSVPGITSVDVTAENGVTVLSYVIIFNYADPVPTIGAPDPVHDEVGNNVVSIYSDSYTNLAASNFNPNWGQSTQVVVDEQIGGNNTIVYNNLNYQGTNLGSADGSPQDFSAHDYLHIDFWTPNATALNFFLISQSSGEKSFAFTIETAQWVSVDIPLTHFTSLGLDLSDIFQFKVDGGDGSTTVYFDNWYFWVAASNADASLSDLQVDGTTIDGFSATTLNYEFELPEGTTTVPAVTATTTDANATYVVNDAAAIPGSTTVVVTAEDGTTNSTYTISFVYPDAAPVEAAPIPSHEEQYVVSVYSDSYNAIAGIDFTPNWGQSTVVSFQDISGNEMMKYDDFNYQGIQLADNQDLSIMEFIHVDIWTDNATDIQLTPISASSGELLVSLTPLNQGSWNSYDIPVEDFTGVSMADIHQLKFDGQGGVNPSVVYIDNIYFWKNPPVSGTDATLSDLQVDTETIIGFSPNILGYNIELANGTTTVPTVSATVNDPNATFIITDAASLPGTTEVEVTADDGTTILTYSVNFTVAELAPEEGAPTPVHSYDYHHVYSIYSDSYPNLENTNFNPSWGQSTVVTVDEEIGGNNTLVYRNLDFQGTNLGSGEGLAQDLSVHDYLHIDFWTPNATSLNLFLISQSGTEVPYALSVENNEWVSVNISMSYFANEGLNLTDVFQFKIDGGDGSTDVYIDNWYFWSLAQGSDASLSNLKVDGESIVGFSSDILEYTVELEAGTTVVPTVTATTNDNDASYVVNDAANLPGTTSVIVTAEDGETMLTYLVNFIIAEEMPTIAAPTPTRLQENVISMFSDVYTDVTVDTWLTDWSAATLEDVEIQNNPTKKYSSLDFAGIETVTSPIDLEAADMTYLHIDFWTQNSTAFRIKLVDFGGDGYGGGNDTEFELEFTPELLGWNSLDISLLDFEGMNMSDINQFIISSNPSGESTMYIDNVYYFKNPVGLSESSSIEFNIYPNPTSDFWYINTENKIHEVQIIDLSGQLVLSSRPEQSNNIKIDASGLNKGVYLIKIISNSIHSIKAVKE